MNFFVHQENARRQTRRMLMLFALAVIAIVAAIDVVVAFAFGIGARAGAGGSDIGVLAFTSVAVLLVIALGSLYRTSTLRGGGAVVARELGGVPVPTDTGNFAYRRLRNVIEEIAIAAGVPVPEIFVLESEAGINAFASGYAPADAAALRSRLTRPAWARMRSAWCRRIPLIFNLAWTASACTSRRSCART